MTVFSQPLARHPGIEALLGEVPHQLLDERAYFASEAVEAYATELAVDAACALEMRELLGAGTTVDQAIAAREFAPEFLPVLETLFVRLAAAGILEVGGRPPVYREVEPLRPSRTAELRDDILTRDPALEPALALLDAAVDCYGEVAAGRTTGDAALLGPARVGLWLSYFHNGNPFYALSNRIAAVAAANRLPESGPFRVLEIGAGAGSAAEALLDELESRGRLDDLAAYDITEPSPFFRRRAERELRTRWPGRPLDFRALDLDRPFEDQGETGLFDLIYGVNVVHVARHLEAALRRLYGALAPGGALVAGECFRLYPGQGVAADMVFQLLRGFNSVQLDPELRPHHGFLEPETWRRALAHAGFEAIQIVPDLERIRALYPRFFAGALCGRRPTPA